MLLGDNFDEENSCRQDLSSIGNAWVKLHAPEKKFPGRRINVFEPDGSTRIVIRVWRIK